MPLCYYWPLPYFPAANTARPPGSHLAAYGSAAHMEGGALDSGICYAMPPGCSVLRQQQPEPSAAFIFSGRGAFPGFLFSRCPLSPQPCCRQRLIPLSFPVASLALSPSRAQVRGGLTLRRVFSPAAAATHPPPKLAAQSFRPSLSYDKPPTRGISTPSRSPQNRHDFFPQS